MSEEYITDYDVDAQETLQGYANPNFGKINILTGRPKEKVVRCRDCAVETINPDGSIDHECALVGTWAESEWCPDGFCAWAKPKEEA